MIFTFNGFEHNIHAKYFSNNTAQIVWIIFNNPNTPDKDCSKILDRLSKIRQKLWTIIGDEENDLSLNIVYTHNYMIESDEFIVYLEKLLKL